MGLYFIYLFIFYLSRSIALPSRPLKVTSSMSWPGQVLQFSLFQHVFLVSFRPPLLSLMYVQSRHIVIEQSVMGNCGWLFRTMNTCEFSASATVSVETQTALRIRSIRGQGQCAATVLHSKVKITSCSYLYLAPLYLFSHKISDLTRSYNPTHEHSSFLQLPIFEKCLISSAKLSITQSVINKNIPVLGWHLLRVVQSWPRTARHSDLPFPPCSSPPGRPGPSCCSPRISGERRRKRWR